MRFSLLTAVIATVVGPLNFVSAQPGKKNIPTVASDDTNLTTLVELVTLADLVDTLSDKGPFTLFAPTNEAFAKLDAQTLAYLTADENKDVLAQVLTYHVVSGEVMSTDLVAGEVGTVEGANVTVSLENGAMINDATVTGADVKADNGVIHVIDTVLIPGNVAAILEELTTYNLVEMGRNNEIFSTLVDLVVAADLVDTLSGVGPFTLFAPTNEAFAKIDEQTLAYLTADENKDILAQVLTYHVVLGEVMSTDLVAGEVGTVEGANVIVSLENGVMINDATVTDADVEASNGVVHVIDTVLIPATVAAILAEAPIYNLVEMGQNNGIFSTLVDLVVAADLVDTLSGVGPFTLFAPTNEAFAKIDDETLAYLTEKKNKDVLAQVLTYHVVLGEVMSTDLVAGEVGTVEGANVTVSLENGVMINDATVTSADVAASNGVIHVIDTVLIPEGVLPAAKEEPAAKVEAEVANVTIAAESGDADMNTNEVEAEAANVTIAEVANVTTAPGSGEMDTDEVEAEVANVTIAPESGDTVMDTNEADSSATHFAYSASFLMVSNLLLWTLA